jgi:hydrogenase maturation factor HypF (carbamoyltransferase family)
MENRKPEARYRLCTRFRTTILILAAVSIGTFVAAMIAGLLVNVPRRSYEAAAADDLERIVASEEYWAAPPEIGMRRSAEVQVKMVRKARASNDAKADQLTLAIALEIAAFMSLSAAVLLLVLSRSGT